MSEPIPSRYFQRYFLSDVKISHWPIHFAIISETTPKQTSLDKQHTGTDNKMATFLKKHFSWVENLTAVDPETKTTFPCWAVNVGWEKACELGLSYQQEVIYYVSDNTLSVTFCDQRRKPIVVDGFLKRLSMKDNVQAEGRYAPK